MTQWENVVKETVVDTDLRVCLAGTTLCSYLPLPAPKLCQRCQCTCGTSKTERRLEQPLRENANLKRKPSGGNHVGRNGGGGGKGAGRRGQKNVTGHVLIRANGPLMPLTLRGMEYQTFVGEPTCVHYHLSGCTKASPGGCGAWGPRECCFRGCNGKHTRSQHDNAN